MCRNDLCRLFNLLIGGVQSAVSDIFAYRTGEQMRILQDVSQAAVQPKLRALAVVLSVDQHLSLCRFKEAAGNVDKR